MKVLDLFSGIGGFSLGLERAGFETVAFCEIEEYPRKVLAKHWPNIPIHKDIRELDGTQYRGTVDVVCGGFPCQDIAIAGKGEGIRGERSGLFSEMARCIRDIRPKYAILENVSALINRGLGDVLSELARIGYDAEWHCIPASTVGAPHKRDRVWIVAYPVGARFQRPIFNRESLPSEPKKTSTVFGNRNIQIGRGWANPSGLRVGYGISARMDRHRIMALGNSVVPQIPEILGRAILAAHEQK